MVYMFLLYFKFVIAHLALLFVRVSDIRVTHVPYTECAIGLRIIWLKTQENVEFTKLSHI